MGRVRIVPVAGGSLNTIQALMTPDKETIEIHPRLAGAILTFPGLDITSLSKGAGTR